mmetsp:Transcript_34598/g.83720  ORF Transcript_34598/g.83720 Transcript_34598/m.83720 type:complete len:231 (+) Transcript_34598:910-1602(+)
MCFTGSDRSELGSTRMERAVTSATYRRSSEPAATPSSCLNDARLLGPSTCASSPFPASVETMDGGLGTERQVGRILRTRRFDVSVTITSPEESTATPVGWLNIPKVSRPDASLNRSLAGMSSGSSSQGFESTIEASPFPARVFVSPSGLILRTAWLSVSATYTVPSLLSTAMPVGNWNRAMLPGPSTCPQAPHPASTSKALPFPMRRTRWCFVSVPRSWPFVPSASPTTS